MCVDNGCEIHFTAINLLLEDWRNPKEASQCSVELPAVRMWILRRVCWVYDDCIFCFVVNHEIGVVIRRPGPYGCLSAPGIA